MTNPTYYDLAEIMKCKRKILDIYTCLNEMEEYLKKTMSGYEIRRAQEIYRKDYPNKADD